MTKQAGTERAVASARVTEENVAALSEALTAVELVRKAELATAQVAWDALCSSRWAHGQLLRVPTIGVGDDPAEGRVVFLEGLALPPDLVLGVAGRALERVTRRLVGDDDVPGELTGALVALTGTLRAQAGRRVMDKVRSRAPATTRSPR